MADEMMGWGQRRAGISVQSDLRAHAANQLHAQAQIAKEARKAREERALRATPKGKAKAKGANNTGAGSSDDP